MVNSGMALDDDTHDETGEIMTEVSIICDRCEDVLTAGAATYPEAQDKLVALAGDLSWYLADRVSANGTPAIPRPNRDLCSRCYERWLVAMAARK